MVSCALCASVRMTRECVCSAFDRGDDYDEYGVCIAYVFQHPDGLQVRYALGVGPGCASQPVPCSVPCNV